MAKEAPLPARFLGPHKVPIGRFEVLMNLIDSFKSFKPLKIRYESRAMAFTNLASFGVAVGVTVLSVEVEV
jgi:hypothetical protein